MSPPQFSIIPDIRSNDDPRVDDEADHQYCGGKIEARKDDDNATKNAVDGVLAGPDKTGRRWK